MQVVSGKISPSERGNIPEKQIPFSVLLRIGSVLTDRRLTSDERLALIEMLASLAGTPKDDVLVGDTCLEARHEFAVNAFGWSLERLQLAWRSLEAKGFIRMEKGQVADYRFQIMLSALA